MGAVQKMRVEQIMTTHWRRRRALQVEAGQIALRVSEKGMNEKGYFCQTNPFWGSA